MITVSKYDIWEHFLPCLLFLFQNIEKKMCLGENLHLQHSPKESKQLIEDHSETVTTAEHAEKVKEPTATAQPLRVRFRWLLLGVVAGLLIVGWRRYKQFADHEYWQ